MLYDLHCHSTASDGSLSPQELVKLAHQQGINYLALTDHDGVDGINQALDAAKDYDVQIIPGIEFSVTWNNTTIHIVGLNIDYANLTLCEGIDKLQAYRLWRANEISLKLEQHGIDNALAGAKQFAHGKMVGRLHFAQYLVSLNLAKDIKQVFKRFLVKNKPGHIKDQWASLEDVISWIKSAGGIAVIAHPTRYKLKQKKLKQLIQQFALLGGQAIEVVSGTNSGPDVSRISRLVTEFNLHASIGSDFHSPDMAWNFLGKFPPLPASCKPVWELFKH